MYIALDIGGTKIALASFESTTNAEPLKVVTISTFEDYEEAFLNICEAIDSLSSNQQLDGIGIAFAGVVREGNIKLSTHLWNWQQQPLIGDLTKKYNTKVVIENDAVCAGLAEVYYGGANEEDNFLALIMGTGIGGAYIKRIKDEYIAMPLEPEYMIVNPEGQSKENFQTKGLLGAYAAGKSLEHNMGITLSTLPDDDPTWDEMVKYLGIALNNLIVLFNPDKIVLSGGIIQKRHFLVNSIKQELTKYEQHLTIPPMELSNIKTNASLLGALALLSF